MSDCQRCGKCCQDLGCFLWTHIDHPLIEAVAKSLPDEFYTDLACDMLVIEQSGRAVCLIQKWLGHKAKPKACRDYPFDGDDCFLTTKDTKDTK